MSSVGTKTRAVDSEPVLESESCRENTHAAAVFVEEINERASARTQVLIEILKGEKRFCRRHGA